MKKILLWSLIALLSGAVLGKLTIDKYEKLDVKPVINMDDKIYMLKYKTFNSQDEMSSKVTVVDRYVYIEENGVVTVYLAISKTKENINKIKKIYLSKKIKTTVEKVSINNDEFLQNLNEYEKLLSATADENSLLIIEKQILSCYEKLLGNSKEEYNE